MGDISTDRYTLNEFHNCAEFAAAGLYFNAHIDVCLYGCNTYTRKPAGAQIWDSVSVFELPTNYQHIYRIRVGNEVATKDKSEQIMRS